MKKFNKYIYWTSVSAALLCGVASCCITPYIGWAPIQFMILQILLTILSVAFALHAKVEIDRLKISFKEALDKKR